MTKLASVIVLIAACSSRTAEHRPPPREDAMVHAAASPADASRTAIEHRTTCGDVTALWRGERDEGLDEYKELWFELAKGAAPIKLPTGEMFSSDWSFDIFSPDCRHVLLLHSHTGPYHIVRTSQLAAYLRGGKPDHVLAGEPDPKGVTGTGVFHDGAWVSNTEVSYQWGCCDPPNVTRFKLPAAK